RSVVDPFRAPAVVCDYVSNLIRGRERRKDDATRVRQRVDAQIREEHVPGRPAVVAVNADRSTSHGSGAPPRDHLYGHERAAVLRCDVVRAVYEDAVARGARSNVHRPAEREHAQMRTWI